MAGAIQPADQIKSPERLLAEAERKIKKLEAKLAGQQETIRDLRSQIRQDNNQAEQIAELKAELGELKVELKEITRANHEYVARYEAIRDEMGKSKGDARRSIKTNPDPKTSMKGNLQAVAA
jgi:DNA repair exonuclease SbcCD ATPase subunit